MNVTFEKSIGPRFSSVQLTKIQGRRITPVPVYVTENPAKADAVLNALQSGLLGRITAAILKSSK